MKATLLLKEKELFPDGSIIEMIVWGLLKKNKERPHGYKYRLYYGNNQGSLVRYDNEAVKGDHKHILYQEFPYHFETLDKLFDDFDYDVTQIK